MGGKTRQWITIGALSVLLIAVAIYRLGAGGGPAISEAGVVDSVEAAANANALVGVDHLEVAWDLPSMESLSLARGTGFTPLEANPFVVSTRLRNAINAVANNPGRDVERTTQSTGRPTPLVRSTFTTGGIWYAEIGGRLYTVGDVVRGFRISRIHETALAFVPLGEVEESVAQFEESRDGGACQIRLGADTRVFVGGRWRSSTDSQANGSLDSEISEIEVSVGAKHE